MMQVSEQILEEVRKATAELKALGGARAATVGHSLRSRVTRIFERLKRLHEDAGATEPRQAALADTASVLAAAFAEEFFPIYTDLVAEAARVAPAGATREARLRAFQKAKACTFADIYIRSARVYKSDFAKWRRDKLPDNSAISQRIENVLSGRSPLKRRPKA